MLPDVQLQITLKKARLSFYLMNKIAESKTTFKFLYDYLMVRRVQPNPQILSYHDKALRKWAHARNNISRVEIMTFTFSSGTKSRSLDNTALAPSANVCCSPWLKTLISMAQWKQTPTNLGIMISSNFRFIWMGSVCLARVSLWTCITKRLLLWSIGLFMKGRAYITRTADYRYTTCLSMAISCYSLISRPPESPRRAIRHSPRMAISGSNWYSANHYRSRSRACCTLNMTVQI